MTQITIKIATIHEHTESRDDNNNNNINRNSSNDSSSSSSVYFLWYKRTHACIYSGKEAVTERANNILYLS